MLNVAICELDDACNAQINAMLEAYGRETPMHVNSFDAPLPFIGYVERMGGALDIIIINAIIGNYNGIKLMQEVQERLPHIEILFVSRFRELVFDSYAVRHAAFIPCPIEQKYFVQGMNRAVENLRSRPRAFLTLASRGLISRIALDDILYLESNLRILIVHTIKGKQEFPRQLESVKPLLDWRFVQCHKSFIVNMDYIANLDVGKLCAFLSTGAQVPISSRKLKQTKDAFLIFTQQTG